MGKEGAEEERGRRKVGREELAASGQKPGWRLLGTPR